MSKKINVKDKNSTVDKHIQRQISWCKRKFPEGTLISYIRFKADYDASKIHNIGLVVGYGMKPNALTVYLRVASDTGVNLIPPNSATSVQKPFGKIIEKADMSGYLSCSGRSFNATK